MLVLGRFREYGHGYYSLGEAEQGFGSFVELPLGLDLEIFQSPGGSSTRQLNPSSAASR